MELFDALRKRSSTRRFSMQVPGNRIQVDLLNYLNNVPVLLPEADIAIELLSFEDLVDYFPDLGPRMIHAPLYLVFRGELAVYHLMNVGYYAEHAAVWLASKGLGSVWQSGFDIKTYADDEFYYEEDPLSSSQANGEDDILPAVLALGYPQNKELPKQRKKYKLQRLLLNPGKHLPQNDLLPLLDAARLAPSEYNQQPWRFATVGDDLVHLFLKENPIIRTVQRKHMQEVAIGCAIGNMEIMAALKGMEMEYGFMKQVPISKKHKKLVYMGSVHVKKVYKQMMFGFDESREATKRETQFFSY